MGEFLSLFIIFLFTPFFWISVVLLCFWILFIRYLIKKTSNKGKVFVNIIGTVIGILIVIGVPLTLTILHIFSQPIRFM